MVKETMLIFSFARKCKPMLPSLTLNKEEGVGGIG